MRNAEDVSFAGADEVFMVGDLASRGPRKGTSISVAHIKDGQHYASARLATKVTAASAAVFAIDAQHAWVSVTLATSTAGSAADLFATADGGFSFKQSVLPASGKLAFVSPTAGFLAGGAAGNRLWRTVDGGLTWARTSVESPKGAEFMSLSTPTMTDPVNGTLPVTVDEPTGQQFILEKTTDGGLTWHITGAALRLSNVAGSGNDAAPSATLAGVGTFVLSPDGQYLYKTRDHGGSWTTMPTSGLPTPAAALSIDFADDMVGVTVVQQGGCQSFKSYCYQYESGYTTNDGGKTWEAIAF